MTCKENGARPADATPHPSANAPKSNPALRQFLEFHEANPHVYEILVRLAREWVRRTGRHRIGVAILWERMRWELSVQTTAEAPKLNNNHRAYYARLIMAQEPDLNALFEIRRSKADRVSVVVT
jgi:hypothetical protein